MVFTFVHTADWQIGKTFARFAPDVSVQLRAARLDAIDRIAAEAGRAGARHVLVAGDVMDSEHLDDAALLQPLARMSAYADVAWHLLPGNHDPARAGGVWARLASLGLPANVRAHVRAEICEIATGVALLPAPLHVKEMRTDPTAWMDQAESADGMLRIGMAHGSVRGFDSLGEAAVPIEPGRLARAGLDYLALGDWHGTKQIAPGVWYSGTPEPDRFVDNEAGHALVVRIAGRGAPPEVTQVSTGQCRWMSRRASLTRIADLEPVEAEIAAAGGARRHIVLALALEGTLPVVDAVTLDARRERLASMGLAADLDLRRLRIVASDDDLAALDDPVLAAAAARLRDRVTTGDERSARIVAQAMRLLLNFDRASREVR